MKIRCDEAVRKEVLLIKMKANPPGGDGVGGADVALGAQIGCEEGVGCLGHGDDDVDRVARSSVRLCSEVGMSVGRW